MNAPLILTSGRQLDWEISPSRFDWQVLLVGPTGGTRVYQFMRSAYSREDAVELGQLEAEMTNAVRFLVRDTNGRVVHDGPVLNALGEPRFLVGMAQQTGREGTL